MRTWQAVARAALPINHVLSAVGSPAGQVSTASAEVRSQPTLTSFFDQISQRSLSAWQWLQRKRTQQLASRRLRVMETVSLGEKRFVSIVQVDGVQFLIGGSSANVSLLAKLDSDEGDRELATQVGPTA